MVHLIKHQKQHKNSVVNKQKRKEKKRKALYESTTKTQQCIVLLFVVKFNGSVIF